MSGTRCLSACCSGSSSEPLSAICTPGTAGGGRAGPCRRGTAALIDSQLAERFQALSAQALDASTARFLEIAEGRLSAANANAAGELETRRAAVEHLVAPAAGNPVPGGGVRCGSPTRRGCGHTPHWRNRSTSPGSFRAAPDPDPGSGHRAAAAGGPGPLGRAAAAPGGRAGRDERPLRLRRAGELTTADGVQRPDMVVRLAAGRTSSSTRRSRWPPTWRPRRRR